MSHHYVSRYDKPSKDLLVDFVNAHNNQRFKTDDLVFGTPEATDPYGMTKVSIAFASTSGLSQDPAFMSYWRVDLKEVTKLPCLVIHANDQTPEGLYKALYDQCGLLVEPELVELTVIPQPLAEHIDHPDLDGFQPGQGTDEPTEVGNLAVRLDFKLEHLVFIGGIDIYVRPSIELLGTSIDSKMSLRKFYSDGNTNLPQIDLFIPKGELYVSEKCFDTQMRRALETVLYAYRAGDTVELEKMLPGLLTALTGDKWVEVPEERHPFNIFGALVQYNGFVTVEQPLTDPGYNYVLCLKLSQFCSNLTGQFKIGYRYASSQVPGDQKYDHGYVPPVTVR